MSSEPEDSAATGAPAAQAQAGQVLADTMRAAAQPSPAFSRHWATLDDEKREYVADVIAKTFIEQVRATARQRKADPSQALEAYLQGVAKGPGPRS